MRAYTEWIKAIHNENRIECKVWADFKKITVIHCSPYLPFDL